MSSSRLFGIALLLIALLVAAGSDAAAVPAPVEDAASKGRNITSSTGSLIGQSCWTSDDCNYLRNEVCESYTCRCWWGTFYDWRLERCSLCPNLESRCQECCPPQTHYCQSNDECVEQWYDPPRPPPPPPAPNSYYQPPSTWVIVTSSIASLSLVLLLWHCCCRRPLHTPRNPPAAAATATATAASAATVSPHITAIPVTGDGRQGSRVATRATPPPPPPVPSAPSFPDAPPSYAEAIKAQSAGV